MSGSGYKASELENLCEGETLMVSGKQIEVMGVISAEDYAKGRCFQEVSTVTSGLPVLESAVAKTMAKPFSRPSLKGGVTKPREPEREIRPRHDPNSPGTHTHTLVLFTEHKMKGICFYY